MALQIKVIIAPEKNEPLLIWACTLSVVPPQNFMGQAGSQTAVHADQPLAMLERSRHQCADNNKSPLNNRWMRVCTGSGSPAYFWPAGAACRRPANPALSIYRCGTAERHKIRSPRWLAEALDSTGPGFFLALACFVPCAVAALTAGSEILRSLEGAAAPVPGRRLAPRLVSTPPVLNHNLHSPADGQACFSCCRARPMPAQRWQATHRLHLAGLFQPHHAARNRRTENQLTASHAHHHFQSAAGGRSEMARGRADSLRRQTVDTIPYLAPPLLPASPGHFALVPSAERRPRAHISYDVELEPADSSALFFPGAPESLDLRDLAVLAVPAACPAWRAVRRGFSATRRIAAWKSRRSDRAPPIPLRSLTPMTPPATSSCPLRSTRAFGNWRASGPTAHERPRPRPRHRNPPAHRLRLHARSAARPHRRPTGQFSLRPPPRPLRIFRFGHDRDAAHTRCAGAPGHWFSERRL